MLNKNLKIVQYKVSNIFTVKPHYSNAIRSFEFVECRIAHIDPSRGQFHQRVYVQLLRSQIPKAQKAVELTVFLRFWDLQAKKVDVNTLMKLTPGNKIKSFKFGGTKNVDHYKDLC